MLQDFLYFWSNKCSFGEHKGLLSKMFLRKTLRDFKIDLKKKLSNQPQIFEQ